MSDRKTSQELLTELREQRQMNLRRKQRNLLDVGIGPKELIWLLGELARGSEFVDPKRFTDPD